jgi:hypothetical protein
VHGSAQKRDRRAEMPRRKPRFVTASGLHRRDYSRSRASEQIQGEPRSLRVASRLGASKLDEVVERLGIREGVATCHVVCVGA